MEEIVLINAGSVMICIIPSSLKFLYLLCSSHNNSDDLHVIAISRKNSRVVIT